MRGERIRRVLSLGEFGARAWRRYDTERALRRCHNIYLVLPQFLVTGLSSIVFALFAPGYSVVADRKSVV